MYYFSLESDHNTNRIYWYYWIVRKLTLVFYYIPLSNIWIYGETHRHRILLMLLSIECFMARILLWFIFMRMVRKLEMWDWFLLFIIITMVLLTSLSFQLWFILLLLLNLILNLHHYFTFTLPCTLSSTSQPSSTPSNPQFYPFFMYISISIFQYDNSPYPKQHKPTISPSLFHHNSTTNYHAQNYGSNTI